VIDGLDWLDLASLRLTTVVSAGVDLDASRFQGWLDRNNPGWRVPRDPDRLLQEATVQAPCGLSALTVAAEHLLERGTVGWRMPDDEMACILLRWRVPLGTIHAAAAAARRDDGPGRALAPPVADPSLLSDLRGAGAVDGHVHVGAALPFDGLFALILDRLLRPDRGIPDGSRIRAGERFADSEGNPYGVDQALGVSALLWPLIYSFALSADIDFSAHLESIDADHDLREAIARHDTWDFVVGPDPRAVGARNRLAGYKAYLHPNVSRLTTGIEDLGPEQHALERKAAAMLKWQIVEDPSYAAALETVLRCEALLHHSLVQGSRSGFDEFLISSERLGSISHLATADKGAMVRHGIDFLSRDIALKGVELRTAEQPWKGERVERRDVAAKFDALFRGYEAYVDDGGGTAVTSAAWPLCLIRLRPDDTGEALTVTRSRPPRFRLGDLWDTVVVVTELLSEYPPARRLIPGIDMAGYEGGLPMWCTRLLFAEFAERLSEAPVPAGIAAITFRVHAGEDYDSALQGLRRIDEAVRWVATDAETTLRVGHALALSRSAASFVDSTRLPPADEAFDDLVWAWHTLATRPADRQRARLRDFLADAIRDIGPRLYPLDNGVPGPQEYWDAYASRFEFEALARVGFLASDLQGRDSSGKRHLRPAPQLSPVAGDVRDELLHRYLTDRALAEPVADALVDPMRLTQVFNELRPMVVDAVKTRQAAIEVCPTSNMVIGGIAGYEGHPMWEFLESRLQTTLNTDDPGIFAVNLHNEFAAMWTAARVRYPDADARTAVLNEVRDRSLQLWAGCGSVEETLETIGQTRESWRRRSWLLPD
jgi:hypothetical protein